MEPTCDVTECERPADWVYIGEAGDLYVCTEHFAPRQRGQAGWVAIEHGAD